MGGISQNCSSSSSSSSSAVTVSKIGLLSHKFFAIAFEIALILMDLTICADCIHCGACMFRSFVDAHEYAQRKIPFYFGETEYIDTPEEVGG